jgi:hypothetical protein
VGSCEPGDRVNFARKTEALAVEMSIVNLSSDKGGHNNLIGDFFLLILILILFLLEGIISHIRYGQQVVRGLAELHISRNYTIARECFFAGSM